MLLLGQATSLGLLKMTAVKKAELIMMALQMSLERPSELIQAEVSDPL